jgi:hypothetical protein
MGGRQPEQEQPMKNSPRRVTQTNAILMPNRESINAAQVNLLLGITQSMVTCLRQPDVEFGKEQPAALDGGAKLAIEATITKACDRLDAILGETTRWSFETQRMLETELKAMYEQNTKLLAAQTELARQAARPSNRYSPQLFRLNGVWVAILGDTDDLDNAICGLGDTPEQALAAFDGLFTGQIPEHLVAWLKSAEAAVRAGVKPPSYSEYHNEQNQNKNNGPMDQSGTGPSSETQNGGAHPQGNSPNAGPDPDGSGSKGGPFGRDNPNAI